MNKFISFILDEKKVRDYFGTYFKIFFILLINSIFLFFSLCSLEIYFYDIFDYNTNIIEKNELFFYIFLNIEFFYILRFNFINNFKLEKIFFYRYTRSSIYIFFIILYFLCIFFVNNSILFFFTFPFYILFLNILIKNKSKLYYIMFILFSFIPFSISFISAITIKNLKKDYLISYLNTKNLNSK